MMFNEYLNHSNQCSNYYSVVRKDDLQMQQADTNRFKQKWVDASQSYPQQYQMNAKPPQQQPPPPPPQQQQQYTNSYVDYNRQSNTPSNHEFIPKQNEQQPKQQQPPPPPQQQPQQQQQYYYPNSNMQTRTYYQNNYDFSYDQNLAMSPANTTKFNKKVSSSSLTNASHVDFNQAPTPSSSTSSVLSPQPQTKIDSPKSWNTPVPTPMSVSQTTPPRTTQSSSSIPSSHSTSNIVNLDLSQELDSKSDRTEQSSNKSILSEININIDELFMYYPSVFEEIYVSLKISSIEQIENDLRRYLEENFKLNLSNNSTPVSTNAAATATAPASTNMNGIRT